MNKLQALSMVKLGKVTIEHKGRLREISYKLTKIPNSNQYYYKTSPISGIPMRKILEAIGYGIPSSANPLYIIRFIRSHIPGGPPKIVVLGQKIVFVRTHPHITYRVDYSSYYIRYGTLRVPFYLTKEYRKYKKEVEEKRKEYELDDIPF